MKSKSTAFLFLLTLFSISSIHGQLITGRVIAETGLGAPAISVQFMNKANTVLTNADGTFKIMATKLPDTLVFSAVGYEPYKVRVTDKTVKDIKFEVVLLKARSELKDVTVVGYGTGKRKDLTSSSSAAYSKITIPESESWSSDRLSGKSSGVSVGEVYNKSFSASGSSSIKIRGASSIKGSPGLAAADETRVASGKKISFNDSLTVGSGEKAYQTKLVTAGEVNDFNKWKMWDDFTESDFKQWSIGWNLFPKQRYCVQLQHNNRTPAVGQEVVLLKKISREIVWKSVTDNTGKAELWAGMNMAEKNAGAEYIISVKGHDDLLHPTTFENGINRMELKTGCTENNTVDIAFVVDATGSMADEIEFLKLELEDVLKNTFDKFSKLDLRASSVFYRDKGDEYVTRHMDFNSDLLKVLNFIKLQKSGGGGDTPEAVESALHTALDSLSWSENARTKLMFLILDAPPHKGTEAEMYALMEKASAKGVRVIPIVCSGADKGTEFLMRSIALATNGTYVFLTDNSGIGSNHLKPTTDVFNVEMLNNLLQRLISQTLYVPVCSAEPALQTTPFTKIPGNVLKVKISPNPTAGRIVIKSNKPLKEIFIADFTGKILMRLTANAKQEKWETDLGQYPSGTYIVKYITTENERGAEKVLVVR
jgi:CarboxypepD_reg-like domain/von Willebrand factor type A domain/Secretion system C-terminal sorting domain